MTPDPVAAARAAVALDLVDEMRRAEAEYEDAHSAIAGLNIRIFGYECRKLDAARRYWQARDGIAAALAGDPHPKITHPNPTR